MKRSQLTHKRVFSDKDYADNYAKRHKKMAENFGNEYAKKLVARGFQKGKIIDVGCGSGATNIVLAEKFVDCEIIGVDLSEHLLGMAEQRVQATILADRVLFEKSDVHELPYVDNSFDVVLNINMVHLVEDPIKMLNEMERVLAPDGCLFIADIRRSWIGLIEKEFRSGLTLQEAEDLFNQSMIRKGNFSSSFLWWRFET